MSLTDEQIEHFLKAAMPKTKCTAGYRAFARRVEQAVIATHEGDRGWQPIETAPKDGTPMLLVTLPFKKVRVGWFYSKSWQWDGAYHGVGYGKPPTHWMPLPEAPAARALAPGEKD